MDVQHALQVIDELAQRHISGGRCLAAGRPPGTVGEEPQDGSGRDLGPIAMSLGRTRARRQDLLADHGLGAVSILDLSKTHTHTPCDQKLRLSLTLSRPNL